MISLKEFNQNEFAKILAENNANELRLLPSFIGMPEIVLVKDGEVFTAENVASIPTSAIELQVYFPENEQCIEVFIQGWFSATEMEFIGNVGIKGEKMRPVNQKYSDLISEESDIVEAVLSLKNNLIFLKSKQLEKSKQGN